MINQQSTLGLSETAQIILCVLVPLVVLVIVIFALRLAFRNKVHSAEQLKMTSTTPVPLNSNTQRSSQDDRRLSLRQDAPLGPQPSANQGPDQNQSESDRQSESEGVELDVRQPAVQMIFQLHMNPDGQIVNGLSPSRD